MGKGLKILILSHMYPNNAQPYYGMFVNEQVRALREQGNEVKVVSPIPYAPFPINLTNEIRRALPSVPKQRAHEGVEVYHPRRVLFPSNILYHKSGNFYYAAIKRVIEEIHKDFKFDVIQAHVALPDGFAGLKIKERYQVPLVTTIHGRDIYKTVHYSEKNEKAVKKALNGSDKIITVSNKLRELTVPYVNDPGKVEVVENGVDLTKVKANRGVNSSLKEQYKNNTVLLSVGYLIERKGHQYVIEAVKNLLEKYPDLKYVIIGDGEEKEALRARVKELGIEETVEFNGLMSHEAVLQYMEVCDVFAMPSWNEAFGVVYAEAMACGKPVVACKGEGIDGIVVDKENGLLVKNRSETEVEQALDYLFANPDEKAKMGKRAEEDIQSYSWASNATKTTDVFKAVIDHYQNQ